MVFVQRSLWGSLSRGHTEDMPIVLDEQAQLERVELDLLQIFPGVPKDIVRGELRQGLRAFDGARVRIYLPVLLQRRVKARLRRDASGSRQKADTAFGTPTT